MSLDYSIVQILADLLTEAGALHPTQKALATITAVRQHLHATPTDTITERLATLARIALAAAHRSTLAAHFLHHIITEGSASAEAGDAAPTIQAARNFCATLDYPPEHAAPEGLPAHAPEWLARLYRVLSGTVFSMHHLLGGVVTVLSKGSARQFCVPRLMSGTAALDGSQTLDRFVAAALAPLQPVPLACPAENAARWCSVLPALYVAHLVRHALFVTVASSSDRTVSGTTAPPYLMTVAHRMLKHHERAFRAAPPAARLRAEACVTHIVRTFRRADGAPMCVPVRMLHAVSCMAHAYLACTDVLNLLPDVLDILLYGAGALGPRPLYQ